MQSLVFRTSKLSEIEWGIIFHYLEKWTKGDTIQVGSYQEGNVNITIEDNIDSQVDDSIVSPVITYENPEAHRNFEALIPFIYARQISNCEMIIDVSKSSKEKTNRYIFSCIQFFEVKPDGIFFLFSDERSVVQRSLRSYIRKEDANSALRYYSSRYSPLIELNKSSFEQLFHSTTLSEDSPLNKYLSWLREKSIWKDIRLSSCRYPFSELLIRSFFITIIDGSSKEWDSRKVDCICVQLENYCHSIKELAENIIFHTDTTGYVFFSFGKREDYSQKEIEHLNISNADGVEDIFRIISIGVYDFSERGIIDTYQDYLGDQVALKDFFAFDSFISPKLSSLDFRYAAHLGLKSFTSSVVGSGGFFHVCSVESRKRRTSFVDITPSQNISSLDYSFIFPGTHYNIFLPLHKTSPLQGPRMIMSSKPFTNIETCPIRSVKALRLSLMLSSTSIISKDNQKAWIIETGNNAARLSPTGDILALDLKGLPNVVDAGLIFKLMAYIQYTANKQYPIVLVNNTTKSVLEDIRRFVYTMPADKIWSDESAVIFFSEQFDTLVLSGESKSTFLRRNLMVSNMYRVISSGQTEELSSDAIQSSDESENDGFIMRPFDMMVYNDIGETVFEMNVHHLLNDSIYKLESAYVKLGDKVIIKDFYEANTLFYNSFFVQRFARLILEEIRKQRVVKSIPLETKLFLLGDDSYADFLLDTIVRFAKPEDNIAGYLVAKDSGNEMIWPENQPMSWEELRFVVITPIGATLTTHDRIVNSFIVSHPEVNRESFIFHDVSILTRDKIESTPTSIELDWGWAEVDLQNKVIKTSPAGIMMDISYQVSLASSWIPPESKEVSFPDDVKKEILASAARGGRTLYPSISRLAIPEVLIETRDDMQEKKFNDSLQRLTDVKDYIHHGNLHIKSRVFRYYFDTESFINDGDFPISFNNWLSELKKEFSSSHQFSFLITPQKNLESGFVNKIFSNVFGQNGQIICFDPDRPIDSAVGRLYKYVKGISHSTSCRYVFVDHALMSGRSLDAARRFVSNILSETSHGFTEGTQFTGFDANIVLLANLNIPQDKIHSFIQLPRIPIDSMMENRFADVVNKSSQFSSETKDFWKNELLLNKSECLSAENRISSSHFQALVFSHKLIHTMAVLGNNVDRQTIEKELWQGTVNTQVAKVWVLCSYPLINKLEVRTVIYHVLLEKMSNILEQPAPTVDDLILLVNLQAALSDLGSVAVLRKDVITKTWNVYFKTRNNIFLEIRKINELNETISQEHDQNSIQNMVENTLFSAQEAARDIQLLEKAKAEKYMLDTSRLRTLNQICNRFGALYAFNIRKLTANDEAFAIWIGCMLRTGAEPEGFSNAFQIPDTQWDNDLFGTFNKEYQCLKEGDEHYDNFKICNREYVTFLRQVYFDNTTVIRRYMSNLSLAYNSKNKKESINYSKARRAYLEQALDGKLPVYLKELTEICLLLKKEKTNVSYTFGKLLMSLCKVMGVDCARLVLSKDGEKSFFMVAKAQGGEVTEHVKQLNENSYTRRILSRESWMRPAVNQTRMEHYIEKDTPDFDYDEKIEFMATGMCVLLIPNGKELLSTSAIGSIDFFYKEDVSTESLRKQLNQKMSERSRLVMIILPEIGQYIEKVRGRNIINDWMDKTLAEKKVHQLFSDSEHYMNAGVRKSLGDLLDYFTKLSTQPEKKDDYQYALDNLSNSFYCLSNTLISSMFAAIHAKKEYLGSQGARISDVFSEQYIAVLKSLSKKWTHKNDESSLIICDEREPQKKKRTTYNRIDLQVFVLQCLHNAMIKHCSNSINQTTKLTLSDTYVKIWNDFPESDRSTILSEKLDFDYRWQHITQLDTEYDTAWTTLTTLVQYSRSINCKVDCGYIDDATAFEVTIYLKQSTK